MKVYKAGQFNKLPVLRNKSMSAEFNDLTGSMCLCKQRCNVTVSRIGKQCVALQKEFTVIQRFCCFVVVLLTQSAAKLGIGELNYVE